MTERFESQQQMDITNRIFELATTTRVSIDTHERLNELRELVAASPDAAMEVLWKEIVTRRDYDDGIVTCEFLALLAQLLPGDTWHRFRQQWSQFSIETRRDLCWAARRKDVFSLQQWLDLFFANSTTDYDRSLLLGAFVAGAYASEFGKYAVKCVRRVEEAGGDDPAHVKWLAKVKSEYGVSL